MTTYGRGEVGEITRPPDHMGMNFGIGALDPK